MKILPFITATLLINTGNLHANNILKPRKPSHVYISHFENVLGTSMELKISATSQKDAKAAEAAALKEIARMTKILSGYDSSSEFTRWLRTSGEAIQVSPELFEVLSLFDQ